MMSITSPPVICIVEETQAVRQNNGVAYHRLLAPHEFLSEHYNYTIFITNSFTTLRKDIKEQIDIVIFSHALPFIVRPKEEWEEVRKYAKVVICDVDDLWKLPNYHPLYGTPQRTTRLSWTTTFTYEPYVDHCMKEADYVTTTTSYLADRIKYVNPNVEILPNLVDDTAEQFKVRREPNNGKLRIGFMGSTTHIHDIAQLRKPLEKLHKEYEGEFEVVIAGMPTGWEDVKDDGSRVNLGRIMFNTLTSEGKIPHKLLPWKDFTEYATMFDQMDVSLVPLLNNEFNACKSPLKLVESCIKGCVPVVSNVTPYKEVMDYRFYTVDTPKGWYNHLKVLVELHMEDKANVQMLADGLYKKAMDGFTMSKGIHKRIEFYNRIL